MSLHASPKSGTPAAATSLYRSSGSEAALSMAQRLGDLSIFPWGTRRDTDREGRPVSDTARRFRKQVFLSIDIPPSLGSMGQEGRLLLAIERAVVGILKSDEEKS